MSEQETKTEEKQPITIQIDNNTAYMLKLQEFDKEIALLEHQVSAKKAEKASFIYDTNVQLITKQYTEEKLKKQVEDEVKTKLAKADKNE